MKTALLFVAALLAQQPPAPSPRADGTIAGQVVDAATGKPVGAVFVTLAGPAGRPKPATSAVLTTHDSRFVFSGLSAGEYGLLAVKAGYQAATFAQRRPEGVGQQIKLERDDSRMDVTIRVWKHAAITGTVVDEAGEPMIGVHVRAFRRDKLNRTAAFEGAAFSQTDDRGIFRISGLVPAEYVVVAGARQIAVPPSWTQRSNLSIRQPPGSPGTATAIEVSGSVYGLGRGGAIPPPPKSGHLFIYPLTFHPAADSPGTATGISLASGEERTGIDIQLHPVRTVRLSGRVTWQGEPASGESLRLLRGNRGEWLGGIEEPVTVTDSDGRFSFPAVPSGMYRLRNEAAVARRSASSQLQENIRWLENAVVVGDADIDDLTVALRDGFRVSGRLEFDGSTRRPPQDRLKVQLIQVEAADPETSQRLPNPVTQVDEGGVFSTAGLKPGRYYVRVPEPPEGWALRSVLHQGRDLSIVPLEVSNEDISGVVLQFTDRISRLSGVVESRDGQADQYAEVLLFPTDANRWTDTGMLPPGFWRSRPNLEGRYSIGPLRSGSYYIVAIPDEQSEEWRDPSFLERLARLATLVTIVEGDQKVQGLQTVDVR